MKIKKANNKKYTNKDGNLIFRYINGRLVAFVPKNGIKERATKKVKGNKKQQNAGIKKKASDNLKKGEKNEKDDYKRKVGISEMAKGYREEIARIQQRGKNAYEDEALSGRLAGILERRLESERNSNSNGNEYVIKTNKDGQKYKIYSNVKGETFREVFSLHKPHIKNGELVDIHEKGGYDNCKCFLSSDGLQGLAIEPNGNIISVYNASETKKGWAKIALDIAIKNGGNRLDCYDSPKQPLATIYSKYGFKEVSRMGYNMKYDHDNIAKNHNKPDVVFMAYINDEVIPMIFNKEDYDGALKYRDDLLDK